MKNQLAFPFLCLALLCMMSGCTGGKKPDGEIGKGVRDATLVVAVAADIDYLNPVVSNEATANQISGMIFPGMVTATFDTAVGKLVYKPILATRWEMSADNKQITFHIRNDIQWDDGQPLTTKDIKFSFELYCDTVVASARQGNFDDLVRKPGMDLPDFDTAVLTPDDSTLIVKFKQPVSEQRSVFNLSGAIVPKHLYEKIERKSMRADELSFNPVGAGPYVLDKWNKQQDISVVSNPKSRIDAPGAIPRIVFRVIPDYTVRLTQLKTGAIDMMQAVKMEDAKALMQDAEAAKKIKIRPIRGRYYDYIAWSNIDWAEYGKSGKVVPHPLFGSKKVRLALTTAIDRQAVIDGFLGEYGVIANSFLSPAFKWAYNSDLKPIAYDKEKAKALLAEEGWKPGSDGVLEKDGKKFSFTMYFNKGNARREYATTIIQNCLKEIGIDCKIEQQEANLFSERVRKHEYEAWLYGWSVGLEVQPETLWGSDFKKNPFNYIGFQNKRVDELCELGGKELNAFDAAPYWKEVQQILYDEQPTTFLYWFSDLNGITTRVSNEQVNILGVFYNLDKWQLAPMAN